MDMDMQSKIANRLKELRKQHKYTQQYIANICSLTRSTYSSYENKIASPPTTLLNKLADIYNVSSDYISCLTDDATPVKPSKSTTTYSDVSLIDLTSNKTVKWILTDNDKLGSDEYFYCYSPVNFYDKQISTNDLMLVQVKYNYNKDDILLCKDKIKNKYFICNLIKNDNLIVLYIDSSNIINLTNNISILGCIKEITKIL